MTVLAQLQSSHTPTRFPPSRAGFVRSHLAPQRLARIFRVQLGVFAQQFLGALILHHRRFQLHFDNLIATLAGTRVQHAFFAQTELLAVLGALRNLEQRTAVDSGHLDLGAEAGFVDAHRHTDLNVIAIAAKEGMRFDAQRDVKVAGRGAMRSGIALAGDAQSGALLRARRNPDLHGFICGDAAIAMTGGACILKAAGSIAARAGEAEAHGAGGLRDIAAAVAFRTDGVAAGFRSPRSVAGGTNLLARDVETHLGAFDRLPKIYGEAIFEIGT